MVMKGYSAFSKAPKLLETHHQIYQGHKQDTRFGVGRLYSTAKMQSMFSTALADWAKDILSDLKFYWDVSGPKTVDVLKYFFIITVISLN